MERFRSESIAEEQTLSNGRPACKDEDPELFFPVGISGPALLQIEEAKAVCRRCPVNAACLNWALDMSSNPNGIWGGMTEDERTALKRRIGRATSQAS